MIHAVNISLYALRRHPASDELIFKGILSLSLVNKLMLYLNARHTYKLVVFLTHVLSEHVKNQILALHL